MELRVLGASGGVIKTGETTAFLLDQRILLDGGTGVASLDLSEMEQIDALLLTHAHLDHIAGAALMLASVIDRRITPLTIYAPSEVLDVLKVHIFNWQIWPDFSVLPSEDSPVLQYRPIVPGQLFGLDELQIEAVSLSHTVPSFAYFVECAGRAFCFCGDTGPTEKLWQRINERGDIGQIFIELSYPAEEAEIAKVSGHYDLASLALDLNKLERPLTVQLMHAKPGYEQRLIEAVKYNPVLQSMKVQHCELEQRIHVL